MLILFINTDRENGFPGFLPEENEIRNSFLNGFTYAMVKKDRTIITEANGNQGEVCAILLSDDLDALPEIIAQFLKPEMGLNICYHASNDNHRGLFSGFDNKYEISSSHTRNSIYHQFAQWLLSGDDLEGIIKNFFPAKLEMVLDYLHQRIAGENTSTIENLMKDAGISIKPYDNNNPTYEEIYKYLIQQV
jgi:hypothetical protein